MSKYILSGQGLKLNCGKTMYRIIADRDFTLEDGTKIKKGEYGGIVAAKDSLSQDGNCWIDYDSVIEDNAKVTGNAILHSSTLHNNAVAKDYSVIEHSELHDNAIVDNFAHVINCVLANKGHIHGHALVTNCILNDSAHISGLAEVEGITANGDTHIRGSVVIKCTGKNAIFSDGSIDDRGSVIKRPKPEID